ncbi:high-potential iron-sulfur protein [Caballeronia sp. LjRoot29]
MSSTRRIFLARTAGLCAGLTCYRELLASQPHLTENDPAAQALGYKADAATVDRARFPKYQAGQNCATCQFFGGKPGDAFGGCPMFGTKDVAASGWCNAYSKRT